METSLHRQLKTLYENATSETEAWVGEFRIDVVDHEHPRLIEIQSAALAALRSKTRQLLADGHHVWVVKPLAARKYLITRDKTDGEIISQRWSPTRETLFTLFLELVHFVELFPHPKLTLEVLLTIQEEQRISKPAKRWKGKTYRVSDRLLRSVEHRHELRTVKDLQRLLPATLPAAFTTEDLAKCAKIPRWLAQKVAYCLRKTEAIQTAGKKGQAWLYEIPKRKRRAAA
ncbi:MAG: hypothetical protein V4719_26305 [Planctomycetota bacterium]